MDRKQAARILLDMSRMLELAGESPFKVRAYERGAQALLAFPGDLTEAVDSGRLKELPGIGNTLFSHVETLVRTGRLPVYDELRARFPAGLSECLRIPRLGAKKLRVLHAELGVDSLQSLERACRDGRIAGVRGFGARSADHILRGIAAVRASAGFSLYSAARALADGLVRDLAGTGLADRVEAAGAVRRRREVVRGVRLVAGSRQPDALRDAFRSHPEGLEASDEPDGSVAVTFLDGIRARLHVVAPEAFPAALLHFSGSESHRAGLRERAAARGLSLSERGLFAGDGTLRPAADESSIYDALGLAFVEPELREGAREIEAAAAGTLPRLVADADLRGIFHVHTDASDGRESLEAMVSSSRAAGHRYVAITDHSQIAGYAGGLSPERVRAQRDQIRGLRRTMPDIRIFHGSEADILADGTIDYGDELLGELDVVIASVHSRFGLSREEQTARLIRAVRNPRVAVLGHPTGRLLLSREGVSADMEAVIDAAAESGCALEINGSPHRLDLDWRLVRRAVERGVLLAVSPDAHASRELAYVAYGVGMARKGWAEAAGVLNCREPDAVTAWLESRRGGRIPESVDRDERPAR